MLERRGVRLDREAEWGETRGGGQVLDFQAVDGQWGASLQASAGHDALRSATARTTSA